MSFSGGKFPGNEIYQPKDMVSEGRPFQAMFMSHVDNKRTGIAGKTISTSPITSIHVVYPQKE